MNSPLSYKRCFAAACDAQIPRHLLMCPAHWSRVPHPIRLQVLETYRDWDRGGRLRPYILATWRAQLAVAEAEHRRGPALAIRAIIAEIEKQEAAPAA